MRINTTLSNVLTLYREYKTSYMATVVSRAQDAVKSTTVLFETLEFFTNRSDISDAIHEAPPLTVVHPPSLHSGAPPPLQVGHQRRHP